MKMTLQRAKNLIHVKQHYGVSFCKENIFLIWIYGYLNQGLTKCANLQTRFVGRDWILQAKKFRGQKNGAKKKLITKKKKRKKKRGRKKRKKEGEKKIKEKKK